MEEKIFIVKREGDKELFNPLKIKNAIEAAFNSIGYVVDDDVYDELVNSVKIWNGISISDIQDQVIETLRNFDFGAVADSYLVYKTQKDEIRKAIEADIEYMCEYINSKKNAAASSATDANANITLKNVSNLESEVPKLKNRLIQRGWMKHSLNELYPGSGLAKQYERDINHHITYPHDEASTPTVKNYCEAVSLYPLSVDGTSTMDGTGTKKPEHLSTYAGQLCNLLFLLSSQCKGAVAFGEFFNFFDHYAAMDFGENYTEYDSFPVYFLTINSRQELKDAWTRVRKYDYYQEHKESVDKYGTILPEMKMTFDEVSMLRYYVEMEGAKRIEEIDRRKKEREEKSFARIKEE